MIDWEKFTSFIEEQEFSKFEKCSYLKEIPTSSSSIFIKIVLNKDEDNASYEITSKDGLFEKIIYSGFDQDVFRGYAKAMNFINKLLVNCVKYK